MKEQGLVIPGPGGDDLLDAVAAARHLGIAVSTLHSHQYRPKSYKGAPIPAPVPEDDVEIELHESIGTVEWARAIDELMRRAGGRGSACRLWRRSDLDAHLGRGEPKPAVEPEPTAPPLTAKEVIERAKRRREGKP